MQSTCLPAITTVHVLTVQTRFSPDTNVAGVGHWNHW